MIHTYNCTSCTTNSKKCHTNKDCGFFNGNAPVFKRGPWKETKFLLCDRYLPYAAGGGYILSHDLVAFIASNSRYLQLYDNDDVSVGVWFGVRMYHHQS